MRYSFVLPTRTLIVLLLLNLSGCAGRNMEHSGQYIKRVGTLKNSSRDGANILRYRPDGKHIAVTSGLNPHIYIYDVETGKRVKKLDKQYKRNKQLTYSGDGKYLVSVRYNEKEKQSYYVVRDVEQNYKIVREDVTASSGVDYYPAPNGKIITPSYFTRNMGVAKGMAKLNIYTPPKMLKKAFWHNEDGFENFSISPDGKHIVGVLTEYVGEPLIIDRKDDLHHLRVWEYPEMKFVKAIKNVHKNEPAVLAWSWDSKVLYTSTYIDRKTNTISIKLWDTVNWQPIQQYTSDKSKVTNAFFLSDNRHIYGYSEHSRRFQLVNCYTDEVIEEVQWPDASYSHAMVQNPVEKNQFAFSSNNEIWLYEIELPTQLKEK